MKKYKFSIPLIFSCIAIWYGCTHPVVDKITCNNISQESVRKEKVYADVLKSAAVILIDLENQDGRIPFADTSYVELVKIDSAVFFNEKKDKCLVLLLQKTVAGLRTDMVQIVQGTLRNNSWEFSYGRLPEVPEVIITVNKKGKNNMSNSFQELSIAGQKFVLNAGTTLYEDCRIDMNYWFHDK